MDNRPEPHHHFNNVHVFTCMSIVAPIALLTIPGRRDPLLCVSSQDFFHADFKGVISCPCGGMGKGVVINIWPVKPFEAVMVIKGYTNKIELKRSSITIIQV